MTKLVQTLLEAQTYTEYETIVYVEWTDEATMKYIEQRIRAADQVTVVSDKLDYEGKKKDNGTYFKSKSTNDKRTLQSLSKTKGALFK